MTQDKIQENINEVLMESLCVDENQIYPTANVIFDLGAESIDLLDIAWKLEQKFRIGINHADLRNFINQSGTEHFSDPFTVELLYSYVEHKLAEKGVRFGTIHV